MKNFFKWLFGRKEKEAAPDTTPPPAPIIEKAKSIPLSEADKKRNRLKVWQSKTIKKKAHRLPLAKMLNAEKYIK